MGFDCAQLKQGVKWSMKGTSPGPMLVTFLFGFVVSAGTWLLNTVLGWLLTGGVDSVPDTVLYYMQNGYDVEDALNIALLELLRMGPGAIFGLAVGGFVLSVIVALWQSAMNVGYEGWCLSMVRNESPPMGKLFSALSQIGPVLVTRVLTGVFVFLWALLVMVGYVLLFLAVALLAALTESELLVGLLMLALAAYLVLGMMWVSARYALVDYLLLDKGLSGMEALRENKRLMQGNIGRALKLQLSFAGWYLLIAAILAVPFLAALILVYSAGPFYDPTELVYAAGGAILGILGLSVVGVIAVTILGLWLKPYATGAMAKFYDWAQGAAGGFSAGPGAGGGPGGWGQPAGYTWSSGPSSGTGMGPAPGGGNPNPPPKPPKPRDDPWD